MIERGIFIKTKVEAYKR